jgi:hypothetical protein
VMPPYFFEVGLKINTAVYLDVLKNVVKPWIDATYNSNYVWQQDSAPAHKSKVVQKYLAENFKDFWPATMWPPQSPDLNPLDYSIWGVVEAKACRTSHPNITTLKASITSAWNSLSEG